jgi:hypothetical protein
MLVTVHHGGQSLKLNVELGRLIAASSGPAPIDSSYLRSELARVLATPTDYPPLARSVVPGDHVILAVDPATPELPTLVLTLIAALGDGGVEPSTITVLASRPFPDGAPALTLPPGATLTTHVPDDRSSLAYLASTESDHRIDLNRLLTDADVVIPIGVVGFDRGQGLRGPWSVLYPGLSDRQAHQALRAELPPPAEPSTTAPPSPLDPATARHISLEASWLLGSRFQVAVLPTATGVAGVHAGDIRALFNSLQLAIDDMWRLEVDKPAEVVVAGLGTTWATPTWSDLARGLRAAAGVTASRGSIVALTSLAADPGPAVRFLAEQSDPTAGPTLLRGRRAVPDTWIARRLAAVLSSHRVYLHAPNLDPELVEALGFIPMDRPDQAQRIVNTADSCIVLSPAELFRSHIADDEDDHDDA